MSEKRKDDEYSSMPQDWEKVPDLIKDVKKMTPEQAVMFFDKLERLGYLDTVTKH